MESTSIDRAFEILGLLDEKSPTVSPDKISAVFGLTRSTTYRYLKILCNAGLLMQLGRGSYSLGPRIVELERKIQISDPVLAAGRKIMPDHADKVPHSVLILCSLWGDRVLCLHQENARTTPQADFILRRARGMPFPLFEGAASLTILANLTPARIKSLYLKFAQEIAGAGLGDNWADFRRRLQVIKKAGFCITTGTFGSEMTAVSAPIFNSEGAVIGSLSRILMQTCLVSQETLVEGIRAAATDFSRQLADDVEPNHCTGPQF